MSNIKITSTISNNCVFITFPCVGCIFALPQGNGTVFLQSLTVMDIFLKYLKEMEVFLTILDIFLRTTTYFVKIHPTIKKITFSMLAEIVFLYGMSTTSSGLFVL